MCISRDMTFPMRRKVFHRECSDTHRVARKDNYSVLSTSSSIDRAYHELKKNLPVVCETPFSILLSLLSLLYLYHYHYHHLHVHTSIPSMH